MASNDVLIITSMAVNTLPLAVYPNGAAGSIERLMDSLAGRVRRVANRARVSRKVSPHVLRLRRHYGAEGVSLPALQRILGHDRLTTTEIYLNLSPEDVVREFMAKW